MNTRSTKARHARSAAVFLALVAAGSIPGCGYRLAGTGTTASLIPAGTTTIAILPVQSEGVRPEIAQRITESLINEFVVRGRYRAVSSEGQAEVVLEGTILSFRVDPVAFSPDGRTERSEVVITARMRLLQTTPEKVLWSRGNFVFTAQYDIPQLPGAPIEQELGAIDEIAVDFARAVVTTILEGF